MADIVKSPPPAPEIPPRGGLWGHLEEQFGLRQLIWEYMTPVETNSIWYLLGGVLAIALVLEILTGMLLSLVYVPDASKAFLIFALVMIHMLRVFISGGYLRGKQGLWLVGVVLAGLTFLLSITGESLHWD